MVDSVKFYFLIFLVAIVSCKKSSPTNHSETELDKSDAYINLAKSDSIEFDTKINYAQKALISLQSEVIDTSKLSRLFKVANIFFNNGKYIEFKNTANVILNASKKNFDTINTAKAYVYLAEYNKSQKINDSAFFYYLQAQKLYGTISANKELADLYVRKSDLQAMENDFFESEKSALEALSILRQYPNPKVAYEAHNLIGICSNELGSYKKAAEYFGNALEISRELEGEEKVYFEAISLNNLGNAYQHLGEYQRAIEFYQDALSKREIKSRYSHLYGVLLDNLAFSKYKRGDRDDLTPLFRESLEIQTELGVTSKIILAKVHLSEYLFSKGKKDSAIAIAHSALKDAKVENLPTDVLTSLKHLSHVDIENAGIYSTEYIRINDSLQQTERQIKDRFARIQFETDEISIQKDKLAEQNRNLFYFFIATLSIGLLLFVIRNQRTKNRELLLKQAQQKANEEIYNLMLFQQNKIEESRIKEKKRIAQELHDGVLGRLFGTRLNLDSLNRESDINVVEKRREYLNELKNIEQDIREISHDLNREKYVLINNFFAILNNLIEEQKTIFNGKVLLHIDPQIQWDAINNNIKINLYRIIQECLQNVNKYANASKLHIEIKQNSFGIMVSVTDDGQGFDYTVKKRGIGIQNMISRAQELDGNLEIKSKKGKGTSVIAVFPI